MKLIDIDEHWEIPLPTPEEFEPNDNNLIDFLCGMEWVGQHLKSLPAIDPVHAVGGCYCRECIFSRGDGEKALECHLVAAGWTIVQAADFCSRGRRREHEKEE